MKKINLSKTTKKKLKSLLKPFEKYEFFSKDKEKAYAFTKAVGVKVCPYCNINYAYTVDDVVRPDLDHFVTQSEDPNSALKWFNLVPSCLVCNMRIKNRTSFNRKTHIHPYYDDFDSIVNFHISVKDTNCLDENSFSIEFVEKDFTTNIMKNKIKTNIKDLKLKERYQYHKDEVIKIFKNIHFYNRMKCREIEKLVDVKGLENSLFQDQHCDINQTSLGKLKRDVIRKYK